MYYISQVVMTDRRIIFSDETREAIRRIFAAKQSLAVGQAARLLGIEKATLAAEIEAREISTVEGLDLHLPWTEVAYLALRTWPLDLIFDALGNDASSLLPALLRPVNFSVLLPAYQVRMLEVLARHERLDAGTYLQGHLLDLASGSDHAALEEQIHGFVEALFFPFGGER
jgi:hypothetical protein